MIKRFQNRIAESRRLLPIVAVICGTIWVVSGLGNDTMLASFACMVLSTFLMAELNNANALIRIYSRMVSCTFLVFSTMAMYELSTFHPAMVILCFTGYYLASFHCYQVSDATGWTFYAYLCLGLASVFYIHILFFLPLLWIIMGTKLMSLGVKTFCASLLGIVTPYWFLAAYYAATNRLSDLVGHFMSISEFAEIGDYGMLDIHDLVTVAFISITALLGIIHFLRTSSNDKIRTQMLYEIFIIVNLASMAFLALQPQLYDMLVGIIIVNTSPLIAHYITLTHTKLTNIVTIFLIIVSVLITTYNLWIP